MKTQIPPGCYNPHRREKGLLIPNWLLDVKGLSPIDILIYAFLVDCAPNGCAYPAQETMAERFNVSIATVIRALKDLVRLKVILSVQPSGRDRLSHRTTRYFFLKKPAEDLSELDEVSLEKDLEPTTEIDNNYAVPEVANCNLGNLQTATSTVTNLKDSNIKLHSRQSLRDDAERPIASHPRWRKMAEKLCDAISKTHKVNHTSNLTQWAKSFELLYTKNKVEVPRIKRALNWYCENLPARHGEKYFLVIESGPSFREKFTRLEQAIAKQEQESSDSSGMSPEDASPIEVTSHCVEDMTPEERKAFDKRHAERILAEYWEHFNLLKKQGVKNLPTLEDYLDMDNVEPDDVKLILELHRRAQK